MEKLTSINSDEFEKGYFIRLECCMCNDEQIFTSTNKKDLSKQIDESGWKMLDSDLYKMIGHHCGCDLGR
jgi:hypothetical protein